VSTLRLARCAAPAGQASLLGSIVPRVELAARGAAPVACAVAVAWRTDADEPVASLRSLDILHTLYTHCWFAPARTATWASNFDLQAEVSGNVHAFITNWTETEAT
jgi:hypothetical protein